MTRTCLRAGFLLAMTIASARAQSWPGWTDESLRLQTRTFDFGAPGGSNENYYDGDFADFDGDYRMDRAAISRFGLLWNTGEGMLTPVVITVYQDRSYTFITKTPPASVLLAKAAKVEKGSGVPNKNKVGKVTKAQVSEIAKTKLPDLNCDTLEAAIRIVEGSARSMGIDVV